jgi:ABC-type transport system involved in cytochrome c biogenesis permease subunit
MTVATTDLGNYQKSLSPTRTAANSPGLGIVTEVLSVFASLRLTVALFALSIVLVLVGTLAQIDHDIWFVVHEYFRTWIAWVDFQVFFPRDWHVVGMFPFPGGWTLGGLLGVNLLAAHLTRFKVTGKGQSLWIGWGLIAAGMFFTYAVVQSGLGDTVRSQLSAEFSNGLWHALRFALGAGTLFFAYVLTLSYKTRANSGSGWLWWLAAAFCAVLVAFTLWLFFNPGARLDASGLRILWQLIKGATAGLILLAGCYLVFGRRAGVVLLHGGIALMMFSELHTGLTAKEARMQIAEGQTVNFAEDMRSAELAITNKSDLQEDEITVIPAYILEAAAKSGEPISLPNLPFKIRVVEFVPNAVTRLAQPGEKSQADSGWGAMRILEERLQSTGASNEQAVDLPAAFLELLSEDGKSLGTYLAWTLPSAASLTDNINVGGKPIEMAMRFKRYPKPYSVKLLDFRYDRYVGTEKAKNFSSEVQLTAPENDVDKTARIYMNNPLRYGGDTLYQADWDKETEQGTVLQVVSNTGWMIPYVSCMLVATGMLYHFGLTFSRFVERKTTAQANARGETFKGLLTNWKSPAVWVPALIVLVFAGWVSGRVRPLKIPATQMQVERFGELPLAYEGRIQPFDTYARNVLTVISGHGKVELDKESPSAFGRMFGIKPNISATKWLLDVISNRPEAQNYQVFRIENLDLLQTLDLKPRPGFRYSVAELMERRDETMKQWNLARQVPEEERTLEQNKVLELANRIFVYRNLQDSFIQGSIRTDSMENLEADLAVIREDMQRLGKSVPRPIPPTDPEKEWQSLYMADVEYSIGEKMKQPVNSATPAFQAIVAAYRSDDLDGFNSSLAAYQPIIAERAEADAEFNAKLESEAIPVSRKTAERLELDRIAFEAFYNHFNPCVLAMALYLFCFVLAASSWLGWSTALNRSANWLLWFTFALHTYALVARIYISGRPPVTNLYSSAVFIGWAAVLFALVYEYVYRRGLGNLLAAIVGFPTLFIAYNLAGDGDTFTVLEAVLDTQFWLATHVVCITLGYATTILAGMMGLVYVVMGMWLGKLDDEGRKELTRMTYGTLCFATFFSLVGTILGGLWADDSWGRFWGWDPKENGALIIVLWNALVLHARWGGMIAHRGLAILTIFGNVVTGWSWFGVNLMGVGLHSYGFTEGRAKWLALFVLSQLAVMVLGIVLNLQSKKTDEAVTE